MMARRVRLQCSGETRGPWCRRNQSTILAPLRRSFLFEALWQDHFASPKRVAYRLASKLPLAPAPTTVRGVFCWDRALKGQLVARPTDGATCVTLPTARAGCAHLARSEGPPDSPREAFSICGASSLRCARHTSEFCSRSSATKPLPQDDRDSSATGVAFSSSHLQPPGINERTLSPDDRPPMLYRRGQHHKTTSMGEASRRHFQCPGSDLRSLE
jgi:hypothetical protein